MLLFNSVSIRAKVTLSFVAILAFTLILGCFSVLQIRSLNATIASLQENVVTDQPLAVFAKDAGEIQALAGDAHLLMDPTQNAQIPDAASLMAAITQEADQAKQEYSTQWNFYEPTMDPGRETSDGTQFTVAFNMIVKFAGDAASADAAGDHAAASAILAGPIQSEMAKFTRAMNDDVAYQIWQYNDRTNATYAASASAVDWILVVLGIMTLATVALMVLVARNIISPLLAMTSAMRELSRNVLQVAIPGIGRRDELGAMANAVQVFRKNAQERLVLEAEAAAARQTMDQERAQAEAAKAETARQLEQVVTGLADGLEKLSQGDLVFRLAAPFSATYEKLRGDFNAAMETMQNTIKAIVANILAVRSGAGEITQASDDLARRTGQQASTLEETSAALDQITSTVRRTAETTQAARSTVASAKTEAEHSGQVVRETVTAMASIEQSSKQISNIIGVIDEIAFQTNLLALNAGVEAARAGDAGRGFAVVATEVRALAQRSADAAKEIKALISTSTRQVENGVKLVGETGDALRRIVEQVVKLNAMVGDIAASAQEQSVGLNEINIAVNRIDEVTQKNASMVEQATAASNNLANEAEELSKLVRQFNLGNDDELVPAHGPDFAGVAQMARSAPPASKIVSFRQNMGVSCPQLVGMDE